MTAQEFQNYVLGPRHHVLRNTPLTPYETEALMLSNAVAGEAGEIANKFKKSLRESYRPGSGVHNSAFLTDMAYELGDLLHYVVRLSHHVGYSLEDIMAMNKLKLDARDREDKEAVRKVIAP